MSRGSVAVVWLWRMLWCFLDAQCGEEGIQERPITR